MFFRRNESILAKQHEELGRLKKEDFRLHQYFDLIGGTSTGSIIAALLANGGYFVAEIKEKYTALGGKIFSDRNGFNLLGKRIHFKGKYDSQPLKEELEKIFKDTRLGDDSSKTGFCVVTKRFDTYSTWPVTNNPEAKYFYRNLFLFATLFVPALLRQAILNPKQLK